MRWLHRIGTVVGLLALLLAGVAVAARFADGPVGPFPGGPLEAGLWSPFPEDWSLARDVREIEFQLLDPPRSRTTWIIVHDGTAYVPCGLPNSFVKRWPHEAERDGRAVLRVDGRLYPVQLQRVTDAELVRAVAADVAEKYGVGGEDVGPDDLWVFRVDPRPGEAG